MKTLTLVLGCLLLLAGCGQRPAQHAGVRLALNWFPEAEHGGFYAAQVHGYYQQQGVQVEILAGGPDAPVIQRVATGAVEFGVSNADDVLNARAQQAPVKALLAPYQINPRCIMVHAGTGITQIDQLRDLTMGLSQRPAFSHYLRKKFPLTGVQIVPYPGNVTQFLMDPRFAQQAYVFSEPFIARKQGADPRVLMVSDIGFNPYASVLIATEETIGQRPEMVAAVVRACAAGWEHYLRDPGATDQHIHALNPEMDLDILAYGAQQSKPLILAAGQPLGHMTLERWQALLQQMMEAELIEAGKVKAEDAFTTRFLP
ncbi:MAG: ABC transporter substrate-binding protein [Candidatus Latescibacteria bacterium]|nr:ABC transporter substrate-binding protein [Candidatus Latescibacterota bacterium]